MYRRFFLLASLGIAFFGGFCSCDLVAQTQTQFVDAQGNQYRNVNGQWYNVSPQIKSASAQPASGKSYALLIGVNDYKHNNDLALDAKDGEKWFSLSDLLYCSADMSGLRDALVEGKFASKDDIVLLTSDSKDADFQPKLRNINIQLHSLLGKLTENDSVLIAFAGHGIRVPVRKGDSRFDQYLCPMDAELACDTDSGSYRVDTLLKRSDLDEQLQTSKAKVKILIMDACRSLPENSDKDLLAKARSAGKLDQAPLSVSELKSFSAGELSNASKAEGLFRLESCREGQKALEEPDYKHGIYSHFMIEGLKGKADGFDGSKKDGKITLNELYLYVRDKTIADVAKRSGNLSQYPTLSSSETNGESFIIAYCHLLLPPVTTQSPPNLASQSLTPQPSSYQPSVTQPAYQPQQYKYPTQNYQPQVQQYSPQPAAQYRSPQPTYSGGSSGGSSGGRGGNSGFARSR